MKRSPTLQDVVDRMQPGVLSLEGFLGADDRPIEDILDADASEAVRLETTHVEIAGALDAAMKKAAEGLGADVKIGDGLVARLDERMGRITCPFGTGGTFQKGEVIVTGLDAVPMLRFSPLSVHLILAHGFYGGRGTRFRVEPTAACELMRRQGG